MSIEDVWGSEATIYLDEKRFKDAMEAATVKFGEVTEENGETFIVCPDGVKRRVVVFPLPKGPPA